MGRRRRWCSGSLALVAATLAAAPAGAQIISLQARTVLDGDFTVGVIHPTLAAGDGAQLLCGYGDDRCVVFNRAMCAADYQPVPIRLALTAGRSTQKTAAPGSTSVHAFAWVQQNALTCSNVSLTTNSDADASAKRWPEGPDGKGATQMTFLPQNYQILTTGGRQALEVPGAAFDDAPADFQALTDRAIFNNFPEACSEAGIAPTRWRLCIGVDYGVTSGYINNPTVAGITASSSATTTATTSTAGGSSGGTGSITPTAWMEFLVATQRAAAPTVVGQRELFGRVELDLSVVNPGNTLRDVVVKASSSPAVDPNDCNRWPSAVSEEVELNISAAPAAASDVTVSIPGDNGVAYQYCAYTRDLVGNLSQPAPPVRATPQAQSDPFDVVDGDLEVGYGFCRGHAGSTSLWPLALAWPLSRRCARRLAQRGPRRGADGSSPPSPPWR